MRVYLALRNNSNETNSHPSEYCQNVEGEEDSFHSYQIIEYPSDQEDSIVEQKKVKDVEVVAEEICHNIHPDIKVESEAQQEQFEQEHDCFHPHRPDLLTFPITKSSIDSSIVDLEEHPNKDCKLPPPSQQDEERLYKDNHDIPKELLGKRKAISFEDTNTKDHTIDTTTTIIETTALDHWNYETTYSEPHVTRSHSSSTPQNIMGLPRSLGDYYSSQLKSSDSTNDSRTHLEPEIVSTEQSYPEGDDLDEERHSDRSTTTESFIKTMKERGLEVVEQEGDGNCLFRAVSLQVYGDTDSHMDVRRRCLDFMAKDEAHFAPFIQNESFHDYIRRKRRNGVHGNNLEIQAISELYNRPVEVFIPKNGSKPINIFQSDYKTSDIPIRLSYHDGNHYNAVIDPLIPTAGLGLGLPNLQPGLADKLQMQQAVDESSKLHEQRLIAEAHEKDIQLAIQESLGSFRPSSLSTKTDASSSDYWSQKKAALGFQDDLQETDFELEQSALLSSMGLQRMEESLKPSSQMDASSSSAVERRRLHRSLSNSPVITNTNHEESSHVPPFASAYASSSTQDESIPSNLLLQEGDDEYPQVVQELVMNGFSLPNVLKAYDLIGDNFDNLLSFLMSTSGQ